MPAVSLAAIINEARSRDLLTTSEQAGLTERLVLPAMPRIVEAARRARERCDSFFRRQTGRRSPVEVRLIAGETSSAIYPVGYCEFIRDRVYGELSSEPLVQSLRSSGVVFKKVFVIVEGGYFQNAIQLGNVYLDVANDAFNPAEPALEWVPISELNYANLESCDVIAAAAERYYRCRVFPNLSFPLLAPFVPLLAVRENGRLDLLEFQNIFFLKDLGDGLRRLQSWLSGDSETARRRLPQSYECALREHFGTNDFKVFPFEYRPCSPREVTDQARQLALAAKKRDQEHLVIALLNLIPRSAGIVRSRQIRPTSG